MAITEIIALMRSVATLECARSGFRTFGGVAALVIGLVAGLFLWDWSGSVLANLQPVVTTIERVDVIVTPPDVPGQDLRIVLRSPVIHNCTRISQQLLYRSVPDGRGSVHRLYFPLGSGLNGAGFGAQSGKPDAAQGIGIPGGDFILTVSLPSKLDPGEYWLIQRSLYDCTWAWGWISRKIPYESPHIRVVVS